MRRSTQLKVRFCGSCWKEKYGCVPARLIRPHPSPSVQTSHELGAAIVPLHSPKDFVLDLLPSADDGKRSFVEFRRLHGPKTSFIVYVLATRSKKCSFYKPEYDAVINYYGELKENGRLLSLSAFKKERKIFVQQCFEVRVTKLTFPSRDY